MPVNNLSIDHILAFRNPDLSFNEKINVLIGEFESGKTTILKIVYSATKSSEYAVNQHHNHLEAHFKNQNSNSIQLVNQSEGNKEESYFAVAGNHFFREICSSTDNKVRNDSDPEWYSMNIPSVYISATEMDIVMNASLPEAKNFLPI